MCLKQNLQKYNCLMLLSKSTLALLFFIFSFNAHAQESTKTTTTDLQNLSSTDLKVPANFTATKVTLSTSASKEAKEEFIKKHGEEFFYVYVDPKGKIIDKEEFKKAQIVEEQKMVNQKKPELSQPMKNLIDNSKK